MNEKTFGITIIIILGVGLLISAIAGSYYEAKYYEMKEMASMLCELNNMQMNITDKMLPYWEDAMREDFNLTLPEITWPDPFDCEEMIK